MKINCTLFIAAFLLSIRAFSQPIILSVKLSGQPQTAYDSLHPYANLSASPGANVLLTVTATGVGPLGYQWRLGQNDLPGQTGRSLVFAPLDITNAGDYTVVVTNSSGSATSRVAALIVDPTFTKITSDPIVTNVCYSPGGTWGDFNNDGFLDLFLYAGKEDGSGDFQSLFRNNRDGSFTRAASGPPDDFMVASYSACWAITITMDISTCFNHPIPQTSFTIMTETAASHG